MYCLNEEGRLIDVNPVPVEFEETRRYVSQRDIWRKNAIRKETIEMFRLQLRQNPEHGSVNKANLAQILQLLESQLFPTDFDKERIVNFFDKSRKDLYEWYLTMKEAQ